LTLEDAKELGDWPPWLALTIGRHVEELAEQRRDYAAQKGVHGLEVVAT
jgi:hypothetical protein